MCTPARPQPVPADLLAQLRSQCELYPAPLAAEVVAFAAHLPEALAREFVGLVVALDDEIAGAAIREERQLMRRLIVHVAGWDALELAADLEGHADAPGDCPLCAVA